MSLFKFWKRKLMAAPLVPDWQQAYHNQMVRLKEQEGIKNMREPQVLTLAEGQKRIKELTEDVSYAPPYELVNPWAPFYNGLRLLFPIFPARFDYRNGTNYIFLTESQLDLLRVYGRYLYETNPYAQGALETLADYTIHTGFEYHATAKPGRKASKSLLTMVDRYLEDFLTINQWWMLEREIFIRKKRDGDAFCRFFPQEAGPPQVRMIEPEQIRSPSAAPVLGDDYQQWSFGLLSDMDDHIHTLKYHLWYDAHQGNGEMVPADEMVMFKNHLDMNVKRGINDFFNLQDILEDASKLMQAGRQGEAVRQAISYVREWALADGPALTAFQNANTDYTQIVATNNGTPRQQPVQQIVPGAVIDTNGAKFINGPGMSGSSLNADTTISYTLRAAAVKWRLPASVMTGDVNANFAGLLVGESPHVKAREVDQFWHKKKYQEVMHRALEIGVKMGDLPQDTCERVEVGVECPSITVRDKKADVEIFGQLYDRKLISSRTFCAKFDVELDKEMELIQEEKEMYPELHVEPVDPAGVKDESQTPGAAYQRAAPRPE
jgi:hypothetical protein